MNISPIVLNNYLTIKKQNLNKNHQTQPNFKSLNCDTISFTSTDTTNPKKVPVRIICRKPSPKSVDFKTKYQKLSQMLNDPSIITAQECIDLLNQLKKDKNCPADIKSEILLGKDKQAMNKLVGLYMKPYNVKDKDLLFDLMNAMIKASPDKETTLAQFTTKNQNSEIPIQIAYDDKRVTDRIFECFTHDSEALSAQQEAVDEVQMGQELEKYSNLDNNFFPSYGKISANFIKYLEGLIKPGKNPNEPTIIRDQRARDEIIAYAIEAEVPTFYFKYDEEDREPEYKQMVKALANLATPEEKRTMFLNKEFLSGCRTFEDIMFVLDVFKDDMEAKNSSFEIISSLNNHQDDVFTFDSLSAEQILKIINKVEPEVRKTLLLKTDKLDLLPISYTDEEMQMEFLKASPDDETLEKQLLALPILTQEALELVPEEKRDEIKQRYDKAFKKRIKSIKNNPIGLRQQIQTARKDVNKTKLGMEIILLHDSKENQEFIVHALLRLGLTGNEDKLSRLITNPNAYVELIKGFPFETVAKNVVEYCKKAPNEDAILQILRHYYVEHNQYINYYFINAISASLTHEQAFEILNLFKNPEKQFQFLTTLCGKNIKFEEHPTEKDIEEELSSGVGWNFLDEFSEHPEYDEKLLDIIFNIALDKNVDNRGLYCLSNRSYRIIRNYNFTELCNKLETITQTSDKKQAERLLTFVKGHVTDTYKNEIDRLLKQLN
ncbi:MAG: hypothetical protein IKU37_00450 [Candidatus Gastranaerophilales bacterium]|nr:hypothetical protein [Candidatus Gastranaerophilales bacterium]